MTDTVGVKISRSTALQRAANWLGVPYSRDSYHLEPGGIHSYRQDCSGLVSMAFHADRSYSTRSLSQIGVEISKSSLQPGDFLNAYDKHTVLFVRWDNTEKTKYIGIEETSTKGMCVQRSIPYPYWSNQTLYKAYRYKLIF